MAVDINDDEPRSDREHVDHAPRQENFDHEWTSFPSQHGNTRKLGHAPEIFLPPAEHLVASFRSVSFPERLAHAYIALVSWCGAQSPAPTRSQITTKAKLLAEEEGLSIKDRDELIRGGAEYSRESLARVIRSKLLELPGWEDQLDTKESDRRDGELCVDGSLSLWGFAAINGRLKRLATAPVKQWELGDIDDRGFLTDQGHERIRAEIQLTDPREALSNLLAACADEEERKYDRELLDEATEFGVDVGKEAARVQAVFLESIRTAPRTPWRNLRDEVLRAADVVDPEVITDDSLTIKDDAWPSEVTD